MSDLRAAIIGYGLAGRVFHGPLIASTPGMTVAAVVTGSPERAVAAREEHPAATVIASADALLADQSGYELVVVATPNEAHAPLARRAIDAGIAVVVDKPLAPTAAEAREVVEHAERAGVPLSVFLNRRWDSDQLTLRRLLSNGELGSVNRFESRFERWRPSLAEGGAWREETPPERGGGVMLDLGAHLVDQATELFGPVTSVYAEIDRRRGGAADDDAFVALEHASGTYSHLWASAFAAAPGPRLRVLGDRAAYVVAEVDGQEEALSAGVRPGPGWGAEPPERWGRLEAGDDTSAVESAPGDWPAFYRELERSLREGTAPPVDPNDAVAGLEILDAARRSAAEGAVIPLGG